MIIFLHGPDTFRSRAKLREVVQIYHKKYGDVLAESYIDARKSVFADFLNHFADQSLFASKRLIVVERALENKEFISEFLSHPSKGVVATDINVIVIFWDEIHTKSMQEVSTLEKLSLKKQEFSILSGSAFCAWVSRIAQSYGVLFEPRALSAFSEWRSGDSWQAVNDIQKLRAYKNGALVRREDLEIITPPSPTLHIFSTIDLLFEGNTQKGLIALEDHIEGGNDPLYLLSVIIRQMRIIALVKAQYNGQSAVQKNSPDVLAGIHPFVLRKSISLSRRVSWERMRRLSRALCETDHAIKKGILDPRMGIELLALRIAQNFTL